MAKKSIQLTQKIFLGISLVVLVGVFYALLGGSPIALQSKAATSLDVIVNPDDEQSCSASVQIGCLNFESVKTASVFQSNKPHCDETWEYPCAFQVSDLDEAFLLENSCPGEAVFRNQQLNRFADDYLTQIEQRLNDIYDSRDRSIKCVHNNSNQFDWGSIVCGSQTRKCPAWGSEIAPLVEQFCNEVILACQQT